MPAYDGKYVSTAEVRDEGVTVEQASDDVVARAIKAAERFIESNCNRWFYKSDPMTLVLDGGEHYLADLGLNYTYQDTLDLAVPVITLTGVRVNGITRSLTDFIVLNHIGPPNDDRYMPRIIDKLRGWPEQGLRNIELDGTFGFVEDATTGEVPELITLAARKLAIKMINNHDLQNPLRNIEQYADQLKEEEVPGYRYARSEKLIKDQPFYYGDIEIDGIIDDYRYKYFTMAV